MNKPLVSVIIPNYNYSQYVGETVESVLLQTYKNIEIVVVDDGSTDDSLKVLEKFGDKIKVLTQKNAGVSVARNNGVNNSQGDFIAFLDADDVWLPQKAEKQVERFLREPQLGLVHVGIEEIDSNGDVLQAHLNGQEGDVSNELLIFRRPVILGGGSGIMMPRKVFEEVGGFDTRLSTSADWDIFYQISSRYQVGFIKEVLLRYRMHGSNMHGNIPRMEREMLLGFEKAFREEKNQSLKKTAYGNLHLTLAGCYLHNGNMSQFARHLSQSIWLKPSNLKYIAEYPKRFLSRNKKPNNTETDYGI